MSSGYRAIVAFLLVIAVISQTHAAQPVGSDKNLSGIGPTILFDANTGEVLATDRAGEPWYPASLTKLMTAFVVFKKIREGKLALDQKIPVSALASQQAPSKVGIPPGNTVAVDWALQAMLIYSANDMAYVLAEGASGSIAAFATEMNQIAKELGMTASHFVNPNGLFDPRQITSARDLGVLSAVLLKEFPQHAHYFDQDFLKLGNRRLLNRNSLLRQMPEADGMKTGFVCNSGFNLVASATRNGRRLMAVVMGTKSGYARTIAAQSLLEKGFARTADAEAPKLAWIANLQKDAIAPVDMTGKVCPRKDPVMLVDAEILSGWAVSFGTYENAASADLALRSRLLSPTGLTAPGSGGIVRLPDKSGYMAMISGLNALQSVELCHHYRAEQAVCDVQPPAFVDTLAASAKMARDQTKLTRQKTIAQGSETLQRKSNLKKRIRKKRRN